MMTFIAPRDAADALQRRGIAVHGRERGSCELKSLVFAETVKTYGFLIGRLQSTRTRRQQGSVSRLTILRRALLFFLFACFTVLHFCITRCATGQSFEGAFPTLRQVHCDAARKGSHLPFQLSGVRRGGGGWGIRWQHYDICQFQSFYTGFLTVNLFYMLPLKKNKTVLWSQTYSGLILKRRWTIMPLFYRRWLILADLFDSEICNA